MVFHGRLYPPQKADFKVSHLCYASYPYPQYQVAVKLPGSFRLSAVNRHLHRYCIFTEQIPETVLQSLHHSCASELTRQGISLGSSTYRYAVRTLSSCFNKQVGVWFLRILEIETSFFCSFSQQVSLFSSFPFWSDVHLFSLVK